MPLHCTAIGKVRLAHTEPALFARVAEAGLPRRTPRTIVAPGLLRRQLEQVRATGVAYEYEESATGIVCIAAPVLDQDDVPVAAISVTGPVTRFPPDAHATAAKAAAAGISSILARRAQARPAR